MRKLNKLGLLGFALMALSGGVSLALLAVLALFGDKPACAWFDVLQTTAFEFTWAGVLFYMVGFFSKRSEENRITATKEGGTRCQ